MPGFNIPFEVCVEDQPTDVPNRSQRSISDASPSNTLETARSHRFRLNITFAPAFQLGIIQIPSLNSILEFFPKKIGRPEVEIDTITIHNGQDEIFRPGKQHHQPIEIEFYEVVGRNQMNITARSLFNWWHNQTLVYEESMIRAPSALNNTVSIAQLDGYDEDIWNYYLYRCWPIKVTPRDHDYTESAIQNTIIQLRYDKVDEKKSFT